MLLSLIIILMAAIASSFIIAGVVSASWKNGYKGIVIIAISAAFMFILFKSFALAENAEWLALNWRLLELAGVSK